MGKLSEFLLLVSVIAHGFVLGAFDDVVGFDEGRKEGEPLLHIEQTVIPVVEDADNLDLVTWTS